MQNLFVALLSNYIDKKFPLKSKPQKQVNRPRTKRSKSSHRSIETVDSACSRVGIRRTTSEPLLKHQLAPNHLDDTRSSTNSGPSEHSDDSPSAISTQSERKLLHRNTSYDPTVCRADSSWNRHRDVDMATLYDPFFSIPRTRVDSISTRSESIDDVDKRKDCVLTTDSDFDRSHGLEFV